MFVWTGILLDNQLCELKNKAMQIENELDFKPSCHTLPSHISLKISFFIDDDKLDELVEDLISIIHLFSGKLYGLRKSQLKNINEEINNIKIND